LPLTVYGFIEPIGISSIWATSTKLILSLTLHTLFL
jgi:hypothetical protein